MKNAWENPRGRERRGVVVVVVALSMVLVLSCTALAIDLALLYMNRNELQRAADAAALAGASAYFTNAGLAQDLPALREIATDRATEYAQANTTQQRATQVLIDDIVLGHHDFAQPQAPLDTGVGVRLNAVEVTTRRTEESPNGPVTLFFARTFGISTGEVTAIARAAADDRAGGIRPSELENREGPNMLPITIDVKLFEEMAATGSDDFSYDDGSVRTHADGVREVSIYPWKTNAKKKSTSGDESLVPSDGAGNFGLLDFGAGGTDDIGSNIREGLSADQIRREVGTSELIYTRDDGSPNTYTINGESGMRSSLVDDFSARIGDVVGVFVHDSYTNSGTGCMFRNVGIRFVRVIYVNLRGSPASRRVTCQPVPFDGSAVVIKQGAKSTEGKLGRIMLVR